MAKKLKSIRVSDETNYFLEKLSEKRQTSQSNIIDEAIRILAKKEKITDFQSVSLPSLKNKNFV